MPDRAQFESLKLELLRGGVAPSYVERTILELREHCEDLEADALAAGLEKEQAARLALAQLGSEESIAAAVLARGELLVWTRRWPRTASCLRSAATIVALPGLPVAYCIDRGAEIARWSAALGSALVLVSALLACLNWMILLG
ncbi:MAG TPA: hypothetical protein VFX89_08490 [Gammaproteobacteria bacterium]|nr:hypothetical protein [Gammaproteobacteria bacterium]